MILMNRKQLTNPWVYVKLHNSGNDEEEEYCGNYSFICIEDGSKKVKERLKKKELQIESFISEELPTSSS
jgi:hypothetical protein